MATNVIPRTVLSDQVGGGFKLPPAILGETAAPVGAANPKAIAEVKLGRPLDPRATDFQATMSAALGKPYEQLFDPKFGSVVFLGLTRVLAAPGPAPAPAPAVAPTASSAQTAVSAPAALSARTAVAGPAALAARAAVAGTAVEHLAELTLSPTVHEIAIERPVWWPLVFTDLTYAVPGEFIVDVPTATSPVQGGLGDCWLISAMASVAWCHSDLITEKTLKDGTGDVSGGGADYEFTFYSMAAGTGGKSYSVKDDVPQANGQYIYARSSVAGETWPANLEKAFIAVLGATGFGEPSSTNYNELNSNWPDQAVAALVGRPPWRESASASGVWAKINSHCKNGVAVDPMTAWTFGTGSATVSYDSTSGIVASHAYSILGTETSGGQNYVVLRNPWGYHEGTLNVLPGSWQGLTLPGNGVFALRMDTFSQYYAAVGGA